MASRTSLRAVRRSLFDVGDLLGGALRVAFDEASGQFGFEDDDREGVAEDVVKVAGDAFAFGYSGEVEVFFLGQAELVVGASLFGEKDVAGADDEDEEDGDETLGHPM